MTILWIYNMPLVPEAGGTERITSLVAKGLSSLGHNCMGMLVFNDADGSITYDGKSVTDLYDFLKGNHVDVVINQIAYAKWLLNAFLSQGGSLWHSEGGKIISCLHFDPCNPSYVQLLRSCERLSFWQYVILAKHYLLGFYYKRKQQKTEGDIYNYIYDNSDAMVALSETHFGYLKHVMNRNDNDYSRLYAIGNPLTFPEIQDKSIIETKTRTVMVCARMSEYHKRITYILKAWSIVMAHVQSDGWNLQIIGDGPDLERYKRIVQDHNISNVEFLGQQSPYEYYKRASILLLASSAEGWGLTITEGLQNGVVPVVMDSSSVYSDIIQNRFNGLLTPNNDISAFVNGILELMSDNRMLNAMQVNAIHSANNFTLEKMTDKWQSMLVTL